MRTLLPFVLLVGACEEPEAQDLVTPDAPAPVCEPVASRTLDAPWEVVDAIGTSPDALVLDMLGEWKGMFEDTDGGYQPASVHLFPSDALPEQVDWASSEGPCFSELVIPVDLYLDVPCLIYGDIVTTVTVRSAGSGDIAQAKISAPRNLLDRPDHDGPITALGHFDDGVMALQLVWAGDGEDEQVPAGQLSAALQ